MEYDLCKFGISQWIDWSVFIALCAWQFFSESVVQVAFGQLQVMPYVKGFLDRYPEIKLDLRLSDRFSDFVEDSLDLAIRIGQVSDPNLITHALGVTRRVTIASVDYFRDRPEPQTPADLVDHNCIVYTRLTTANVWHFQTPTGGTTQVTVCGNLRTDNSPAIRAAVMAGLGIAICPVWLFGELLHSDQLKIVLQDYQPTTLPIQAIFRG
jgi:DNA-binding transcriptional LysR family regulator